MRARVPGWTDRTQVERVRVYTVGTLYVIFWLQLVLTAISTLNLIDDPVQLTGVGLATLVLGVVGVLNLREAIRLYPERAPVPWPQLGALVAAAAVATGLIFLLPEKAQLSAAIVVIGILAWGAGGFRDRSVQVSLYVACPLLAVLPTGHPGLALVGAGVGLFLVFTVQSSLWLLDVVTQLENSRNTQAALAVAEERLRFSRDVHDVLGRQLSTIAVQAELAATLAARGDGRAAQRILEVRETAHEALREARELARGYRPLDLEAEIDGAVSLLRSAGISATTDLAGLPDAWHEPVARVIREAVTNVLRHSRATHVEMTYAAGQVVITNNGSTPPLPPGGTKGTGLASLAEQLAPSGAALTTDRQGEVFVVRVQVGAVPTQPAPAPEDVP